MSATGTRIDPAAWYDDAALYDALEISYQAITRGDGATAGCATPERGDAVPRAVRSSTG